MDDKVKEEFEKAAASYAWTEAEWLEKHYDKATLVKMLLQYKSRGDINGDLFHQTLASDLRKSKELHNLHRKLHRMRKHIARLKAPIQELEEHARHWMGKYHRVEVAAREVLRISDRKHNAWDALHAALGDGEEKT